MGRAIYVEKPIIDPLINFIPLIPTNNQAYTEEEKILEVTVVSQLDAEPERCFTSHDISDPVIVDISSVIKDNKSQLHKKREAVQDVFDFTAISVTEKNHMIKISITRNLLPITKNTDEKNSDNILEKQAKPLVSATQAEDDFDKMIMKAFEKEETRIEKERQNKATSNVQHFQKDIHIIVYLDIQESQ
ncbi:2358_t:CDS:2 [Dentiscutata heterogama]|uniref:2358_t:CDS:1 n=1 Tax=Dentiscutata heterogama TaxID=1316150 RepID=A0ACA9KFF9_9GLOM|nr:2358_t:CDS:2 [Dentiscutata heterogama]